MDRVTVQPGQIPLETDVLRAGRFAMVGLAKLSESILGTATLVNGFSLSQTTPASLSLQLGPGTIYELENLEATTWSSLLQDLSHSIVKQGIMLDPYSYTFTPPSTAGYAQNFLIQVEYIDSDTDLALRSYFNSANPAVALQGAGNSGQQDSTTRAGRVSVSIKAGVAATAGTQTTPSPDAGYVGLYVVTVAQGATALTSGNFSVYATAPFIPVTLPQVPTNVQNDSWCYAIGTGSASTLAASISPAPSALVAGMRVSVKMPFTNTGATTFNLNGLGAKAVVARDNTALNAGDLVNGSIVDLRYNGTAWQLISDRSTVLTVTVTDNSLWHIGSATAGTATAMTTTLSPVPSAATAGLCMRVPITVTNGASPTIDFGFGPKPIVKDANGVALSGGEMVGGVGYYADFIYDGTNARLLNPFPFTLSANAQVFSATGSSTWTCPAGVYRVRARVWGAGGGGGSSGSGTGASGCGGNGGGYAEGYYTVVPGTNYTIIVGAGGAGYVSVSGQNGSNGGTSSFASFCSATGGGGGGGSTSGVSGLYGTASATIGQGSGGTVLNISGSVAANAYPNYGSGGGGAFGTSGTGMSINGGIGANYPAGGGGGAASGYGGQVGANGLVVLEW